MTVALIAVKVALFCHARGALAAIFALVSLEMLPIRYRGDISYRSIKYTIKNTRTPVTKVIYFRKLCQVWQREPYCLSHSYRGYLLDKTDVL